jgi:hypothetical protein
MFVVHAKKVPQHLEQNNPRFSASSVRGTHAAQATQFHILLSRHLCAHARIILHYIDASTLGICAFLIHGFNTGIFGMADFSRRYACVRMRARLHALVHPRHWTHVITFSDSHAQSHNDVILHAYVQTPRVP